jgi:hypothetical protein
MPSENEANDYTAAEKFKRPTRCQHSKASCVLVLNFASAASILRAPKTPLMFLSHGVSARGLAPLGAVERDAAAH